LNGPPVAIALLIEVLHLGQKLAQRSVMSVSQEKCLSCVDFGWRLMMEDESLLLESCAFKHQATAV
jgi:hypothetical protein